MKGHIGFPRVFATFSPVAGHASGNKILPGVAPPAVAGNDVVECEVTHLATAVLTGEIVSTQDLSL